MSKMRPEARRLAVALTLALGTCVPPPAAPVAPVLRETCTMLLVDAHGVTVASYPPPCDTPSDNAQVHGYENPARCTLHVLVDENGTLFLRWVECSTEPPVERRS